MAVAAFVIGLLVGAASGTPASVSTSQRFVDAWSRGDWATMWSLTDPATRARLDAAGLAQAYRATAATATLARVRFGRARGDGGDLALVPAVASTRLFGTLRLTLRVPTVEGGDAVAWSPALAFPGLRRGELLTRRTELPPRAALLARNGTPLAEGPARTSPLGSTAAAIAGSVGPIPADEAARLHALGVPGDARVGVSGLERVFDDELRGRPGGELLAGSRVLARVSPRAAASVRTTISPAVEQATVAALAGRLGGVIALRPSTGEVLGAAGIGWSVLQPPGSTFKIVTVSGVLGAGVAGPSTTFPVQTQAILAGVPLQNANGEACGGTLAVAFAVSCNSVFAPLGVRLGARRLVAAARAFGFDEPPGIPGAATPTLPAAGQIGDDLALGSTAIGQGRVQATALEMAIVAATIADHGRRPRPVLRYGERRPRATAVTPHVAAQVRRMMEAVVSSGTGTGAAISGVTVAGKTGTAELRTTTVQQTPSETAPPANPRNTDAWFVGFAPALSPRIAVGVLLVGQGAGGATAAPAARQVLEAGLR